MLNRHLADLDLIVMKSKTAIVTGATSGIGAEYAKALARQGYQLLITGRRVERLQQLKSEIEKLMCVRVEYVIADLAENQAINHLVEVVNHQKNIEVLVNSAGFGCRSNFFEEDYSKHLKMIQVHVAATLHLIHAVVPLMQKNKKGYIINVSSLSAFMPSDLSYCYCGTKAFMVAFSESLHIGLKGSSIKVQVICPGFTRTEFHNRFFGNISEIRGIAELLWMNPEKVVTYSLKSLSNSRVVCIPGIVNRLLYQVSKIIPKQLYYFLASHKELRDQRKNNVVTSDMVIPEL